MAALCLTQVTSTNLDYWYRCKFLLQQDSFSELLLCLQFLRLTRSIFRYTKEVYFGVAHSGYLYTCVGVVCPEPQPKQEGFNIDERTLTMLFEGENTEQKELLWASINPVQKSQGSHFLWHQSETPAGLSLPSCSVSSALCPLTYLLVLEENKGIKTGCCLYTHTETGSL